jgi:hypothetical protein
VVATQVDVHQPWYELVVLGGAIEVDTLNQGRGTVTYADDGNIDLSQGPCGLLSTALLAPFSHGSLANAL